MIHGISASIGGLLDALKEQQAAAHNIANVATDGFEPIDESGRPRTNPFQQTFDFGQAFDHSPVPLSRVDLATEEVQILLARNSFRANAAALRAQFGTQAALLDQRG